MRHYWIFLILFLFTFPCKTFSQSSSVLKKRKDAINREITALKLARSKIDRSKKLSLQQINLLNTQILLREEKIGTINSEINLLDEKIQDDTRRVKSLQSELAKLKYEYSKMIQFAYKNQNAYNKLMFVFASADFNQAFKRLKYIQQFSESRRRHASTINKTQGILKTEINILDKNKKEKSTLLADQEKEKQNLGSEKNSKTKVLTSLTKQEQSLKQQLDKKQRESATLAKAIQTAIRKEIEEARRKEAARIAAIKAREKAAAAAAAAARKKSASTTTTAKTPAPVTKSGNILSAGTDNLKLSAGFLANRGRLPSPVNNGIITQHFGAQKYGNVTIYNDGINIKAPAGAAVHAVFAGDVIKVIYILNSYTVMIRHGEYFTVYSKIKNPSVSSGQKVTVKQVLGTVATDPAEHTTELQFQIWKGGSPVNPSSWIAR